MGQSDNVNDAAAIVPVHPIDVEEVMDKDEVESIESGSHADKIVVDRSESHESQNGREHRFNLRERKHKNSIEMELGAPVPEDLDEQEPRTFYLGIHGWMELKEGSTLTRGTFRETTTLSREEDFESAYHGTEDCLETSPTFNGWPTLISNSSKSDDSGDPKAAKKAALRNVVVRPLPMKASKKAQAKDGSKPSNREKAIKRLKKKPIKAGLSKTVSKKKMKSGKSVRSQVKKVEPAPAPFKPVEAKKASPAKIPPKGRGGPRISSYKSSRSVAMELAQQKTSGWKPGDYNITNITFDDVLLGRGNNLVTYEGNVRYRKVILMYRDRYIAAGRIEKGQIAKKVIETVWSRGGRFLESKSNDQRYWREAELPRLLEKATQALREKHAWKEHPEDRSGRVRY